MAWFTAKEWKNRLVEFAGRRSLKNVSTNETTVYDVTRNEGRVSQEGDSFSATTMNDLEQRISDAFVEAEEANTQLSSDLGGLTFGQTAEGEWGYKPEGADSVIPFSNAVDLGDISASSQSSAGSRDSTFDLSAYIGYSDISANDIIFMPLEWRNTAMSDANLTALQTPTVKNYDNTTGIVTLQGMSGRNYTWGATITKAHFVILK